MGMTHMNEGQGERIAKVRKWRLLGIFALSAASAAVLGYAVDGLSRPLSPAAAIAGTVAVLLLVVGVMWLYMRAADELEQRDNYIASMVALLFFFAAYPVWLMLWRGGLVLPPKIEVLYFSTALVTLVAYLVCKLRH